MASRARSFVGTGSPVKDTPPPHLSPCGERQAVGSFHRQSVVGVSLQGGGSTVGLGVPQEGCHHTTRGYGLGAVYKLIIITF